MNHDSVHVDRHNVARFYVFSGVVADDFFNYCIAHRFFLPLLIQSVALAHCLYQAACLNDIHQVLRQSCDRVCFSVVINMLIHLDGDGVALFDIVVQIRLLDQKKAVIDGVAEKDPGKGFRDNAGNAERLMISGACSLEEPQPKFFPATMMSPFSICPASSGRSGEKPYCFISSIVFKARYSVGIMISVSISSPSTHTFPVNASICLFSQKYYVSLKENGQI